MEDNFIDWYDENADWLRTKWKFAPYKSEKFFKQLQDVTMTLAAFKTTQMYFNAINNGLIVDDEWTGIENNWRDVSLLDGVDIKTQIGFRMEHIRDLIINNISDAQAEAGRALTKEEIGLYIIEYFDLSTTTSIDAERIEIGDADVSGMQLIPQNQRQLWFLALRGYSSYAVDIILENKLPQIWAKQGARAVYYPKRNLIVVPHVSIRTQPQVSHAVAHYIETLGQNGHAIEIVRNNLAYGGTLHLIRQGLFALRGPWIDPFDGALYGHTNVWFEKQYQEGKEFTKDEINKLFTGQQTEFFATIAQRFIKKDPVEIATVWTNAPEQILLYFSVAAGNFFE